MSTLRVAAPTLLPVIGLDAEDLPNLQALLERLLSGSGFVVRQASRHGFSLEAAGKTVALLRSWDSVAKLVSLDTTDKGRVAIGGRPTYILRLELSDAADAVAHVQGASGVEVLHGRVVRITTPSAELYLILHNATGDPPLCGSETEKAEASSWAAVPPSSAKDRHQVATELSVAPSLFPTLRLELVECEEPRVITPNCPTRIMTEYFDGVLLPLLRPPDLTKGPYGEMFEGKQRLFNIQVQGRFRKKMRNPYFGGEVTSKMELGLLAKGMARTILSFIRTLIPEMHNSFGDDDNVELAHITAPLYKAAECFIVTPPGQEPPQLGLNWAATDLDKQRRSGRLAPPEWDTTSVYSFSFHSMFIDFASWRLVNFPLIGAIDLHLMWNTSAFRFSVYEPDFEDSTRRHCRHRNKYLMVLQLQHLSNMGMSSTSDNGGVAQLETSRKNLLPQSGDVARLPSHQESSDDDDIFVDALSTPDHESPFLLTDSSDDESHDIDEEQEEQGDRTREPAHAELSPTDSDHTSSLHGAPPSHVATTFNPSLKAAYLCPAYVEVIDRSSTRNRRSLLYMFVLRKQCIVRSAKAVNSLLGFLGTPNLPKHNPRHSEKQVVRLQLGELMSEAMRRNGDQRVEDALHRLLLRQRPVEESFLLEVPPTRRRSSSSSLKRESSVHVPVASGVLARGLGDYHWVEEYAVLTTSAFTCYSRIRSGQAAAGPGHEGAVVSEDMRSPHCKLAIQIRDILMAKVLLPEDVPYLPGLHFFEMETLGRVYTFIVPTRASAEAWVAGIKELIMRQGQARHSAAPGSQACEVSSNGGVGLLIGSSTTVAGQFLTSPSHYDLGDRVLLNGRRAYLGREGRKAIERQDPVEVAAQVLEYAFSIDPSSSVDELVFFLDATSALKHLVVHNLGETDKKVFFLNLYHLMILHSRLLLGAPPPNALKWCSFFNMVSYEVAGDVYSLAELEHNVIRARMPRAKGALLRLILPTTRYSMALEPDYRITFALNCGSVSIPPHVPVYSRDTLDSQLDSVAEHFLEQTVRLDLKARTIYLPKLCDWYRSDFRPNLLQVLLQHLKGQKLAALRQLLEDGGVTAQEAAGTAGWRGVTVKYLPFSFETRPLLRTVRDGLC